MARKVDINNLRIASPCHVGWETMTGDARTRFCESCSLNVYNVAEMTEDEVSSMITRAEGRVCARIYRRADGTIITRDCPVGLTAYRKRVSRLAGATIAAVLGLFSIGYGQTTGKEQGSKPRILRTLDPSGKTSLIVRVLDMNDAVIPGSDLILYKGDKEISRARSNEAGEYVFSGLKAGNYRLEAEAANFEKKVIKEIEIKDGEKDELELNLRGAEMGVIVTVDEPLTPPDNRIIVDLPSNYRKPSKP